MFLVGGGGEEGLGDVKARRNHFGRFTNMHARTHARTRTHHIHPLTANVNPALGYKGITCFILEREDGVQVQKKEIKLGIKASSTCSLAFDQVRIPADRVLGTVGHGYKYAIDILNEGRIGIAGGCGRGVLMGVG